MIIFGDDEDVAIETADGLLPADRFGILARHPHVGGHFVEEGSG